MRDYDVVIVGGRPAGATLAARLGKRGLKVLVVDRASFPCLPGVPSSPILHAGTMRILDELGIEESVYAPHSQRMHTLTLEFGSYFHTQLRLSKVYGRDYVLGLERAGFDHELWQHLARFPSVTRRENFGVTDVVRDAGDRVVGIRGQARGGAIEEISADCVVGADGRFSLIANKVEAPIIKEDAVHVSTVYFANWEGVEPFNATDDGAHIYTTGRGLDVPMFRMPGNLLNINLHLRADRVDIAGDAQSYYESVLKGQPAVWRRLRAAKQVNKLVGIKRVGNGYRRACGAGWVLVGDALHFKDPVDGQGIFDALLEARLLDEAIASWRSGERSFELAMAGYETAVHAATNTMFQQTVARLRRELYEEPPEIVIKTALRWLLSSPGYHDRFSRYLARSLPGDQLMTPSLVGGALLHGITKDLKKLAGRASS